MNNIDVIIFLICFSIVWVTITLTLIRNDITEIQDKLTIILRKLNEKD